MFILTCHIQRFCIILVFMTDKQNELNVYRQEIDYIDDKIHQLLLDRTTLAHKIAKAKGSSDGLAIRPSREASILRRLFKNHHGDFPFASLARMWREMINAFTLLQSDYRLAVYVPKNDFRCWEIARDQFGSIVKMTAYDTISETVKQAEENKNIISIVPALGLFEINNTKAILRLPLSGKCYTFDGDYDVYAVAQQDPQDSGNDSTLYIGNTLPSEAQHIATQGNKIIYAIDTFSHDGIGCYPNKIGF